MYSVLSISLKCIVYNVICIVDIKYLNLNYYNSVVEVFPNIDLSVFTCSNLLSCFAVTDFANQTIFPRWLIMKSVLINPPVVLYATPSQTSSIVPNNKSYFV